MGDLRCGGVFGFETSEQFVDRQEQIGILRKGAGLVEQFEPDPTSAAPPVTNEGDVRCFATSFCGWRVFLSS